MPNDRADDITLHRCAGPTLRIDMREFRRVTCTGEKFERCLALLAVCRDRLDMDQDRELIAQIEKELRDE